MCQEIVIKSASRPDKILSGSARLGERFERMAREWIAAGQAAAAAEDPPMQPWP